MSLKINKFLLQQFTLEVRNRYSLLGIFLYIFSCIMVVHFILQFNGAEQQINAQVWSALFWLIILFSSINEVAGSFSKETEDHFFYNYYLVSAETYILTKLIRSFFITLLLSVLAYILFSVTISNPIRNKSLFFLTLILGANGYGFLFTVMRAIAGRARNSSSLVALLGFPIVIPILIFITRLSNDAINSNSITNDALKNIFLLGSINIVLIAFAYILFPYLWRD